MVQLLFESPLPLYYQMMEILKKKIKIGELKPGDQLPSERELEETYGVSRMTARRTLVELCNKGYVYRKQGRGTFVADLKYSHNLFRLSSFTEESESQRLKPGARVLQIEKVENDSVCNLMKIRPEPLIFIKRIRTVNDEPVAFEESYIRAKYCSGLEKVDLNNISLYSYLTNNYQISMGRAEQTIEARLAPIEIASILEVEKGKPILYMERITYLEDEKAPIEYTKSIYRGDKYKLMVEMQR